MKKIAVMLVLVLGLMTLVGCSTDNESEMVEYTLTVNVTDEATGNPIEGATVEVDGTEKETDENGLAQLDLDGYSDYTVKVSSDGYATKSPNVSIKRSDSSIDVALATEKPTAPSTVPAAPTLDSSNVISLYNSSGTYTDIDVQNWNPGWGQSGSLTNTTVDGTTVKLLDLDDYQGVAIDEENGIDITGKSTLHISYWTPDATVMDVTAIDGGTEIPHTTETLTTGEWSELEIDFSDIDDLTNVIQLKFDVQNNGNTCQIYMDNIYFH